VCGVVVFGIRGGDGVHASGSGIWWIGGARQVGWKPVGWAGRWGPPPSGRLVVCGGWGDMVGAHAVWVRAHPSVCVYIDQWVFSLGFCTGKRCGDCLVVRSRRSGGFESF
jgi:hypothetical protein